MTSRQRLLTAIQRGKPDRVPIHIRGVRVWDERWVRSRHESYLPLIEAVRDRCDWVAGWSPSVGLFLSASQLKVESRRENLDERWDLRYTVIHTPKGPLTSIHQISRIGMPGLRRKFWVESEEDLERFLSIQYEPPEPDVEGFHRLNRKIGERGIVMVGLSDPISYVHDLLGSELLALWSIERRGIIRMLIDLFADRLRQLIEYLLSMDVRGLYGFSGEEYAAPPLLSPRDFHEFVTRPEKELFDLLHRHDCLIHVHCHGPIKAILEDFVEMGVDCLHPIEAPPMGDMPLAEAKRRIGRRVCLEGNIQIGEIYVGETEEIEEIVARAIEDGAEDGGFILCPTASPHTPQLSPKTVANYLAMIETGLRLGNYGG